MPLSLCLIGCGKMGSAMLNAWLEDNLLGQINVVEPNPAPPIKNVKFQSTPPDFIAHDILVIAVKPQNLPALSSSLKGKISNQTLILSIAAGQSLKTLGNLFGSEAHAIIRAMPNTPAGIGKGISACISNQNVSTKQKIMTQELLGSCGKVVWLNDEALMDAVTALSGSGPAYVYYLIEALAKSGEFLGLSAEDSMLLARQTVIGAAALAENDCETQVSKLRENVTSPSGTTEAALKIMMDGRFQSLLNEILTAARDRSCTLNKQK